VADVGDIALSFSSGTRAGIGSRGGNHPSGVTVFLVLLRNAKWKAALGNKPN
jgi:hypothetical protein